MNRIYDTSTFTHTQGAVEEMKGESQVSDLKVPVCGVGDWDWDWDSIIYAYVLTEAQQQ